MNEKNSIGIDKIQFAGLVIKKMDMPYLASLKNVTVQTSKDRSRKCKRQFNDVGVIKIIIKDNKLFSDLVIGSATMSNGRCKEYCYLTLNISNKEKNNLIPFTHKKYTDYFLEVIDYINQTYHICIENQNLEKLIKIKYIEINCNIPLKYNFNSYNRVFSLFMSLLKGQFGKLKTYESYSKSNDKKFSESYIRGNKSIDLVLYNKTKNLNDTKKNTDKIDHDILRIEIRLKTDKKIKEVFGSNYWFEIDDEMINMYFMKFIENEIVKKYINWMELKKKELVKLIASCRKRSAKNWHVLLMEEIRNRSELSGIPFILDIAQLNQPLQILYHQNKNRKYNMILEEEKSVEQNVYLQNDIEKAKEIIDYIYVIFLNQNWTK